MKAAIVEAQGREFTMSDVEIDAPLGYEVLIDIKASGLCHSDLSVTTMGLGYEFPIVLGHEPAGVVSAVGPNVTSVDVGDHVVAGLVQFCGRCVNCLSGKSYRCLQPETTLRSEGERPRLSTADGPITQFMGLGGFAQQILTHENQLGLLPREMPFAQACLLGCGVLTGAGAVLNTADAQAGDSVVVIGAGGVGMNAVSGARIAGATTIVVVDIQDAKLDRAREFGATHTINSTRTDPVAEVLEITRHGADHVFDVVGSRTVTRQGLEMLTKGGGLYLIGLAEVGAGLDLDILSVLNNQQRVEGVFMGSSNLKRDLPLYASLYLQGRLNLDDLVYKEVSLDRINEGYEALKEPTAARVVVTDLS